MFGQASEKDLHNCSLSLLLKKKKDTFLPPLLLLLLLLLLPFQLIFHRGPACKARSSHFPYIYVPYIYLCVRVSYIYQEYTCTILYISPTFESRLKH